MVASGERLGGRGGVGPLPDELAHPVGQALVRDALAVGRPSRPRRLASSRDPRACPAGRVDDPEDLLTDVQGDSGQPSPVGGEAQGGPVALRRSGERAHPSPAIDRHERSLG